MERGHLGRFVADVLHLRANKISLSILALFFLGTIHASSGDPLLHCIGNKTVYDCSSKRFLKVPGGIPNSVQKLYLGNNYLTALKENTFENLSNITSLSLSHNAIGEIDVKSFHALTNMTELDLSHNRIQYLPSGLFFTNTELWKLDLSNNEDNVKHDGSVFLCNRNLQSLYLKDCHLNLNSLCSLGGFPNLKTLYGGGNKNCGYLHNSIEFDVQCLPGDKEIQLSPGSHSSNGMGNDIAYPVTRNVYLYEPVCPKEQEFPSSGDDNTTVIIVVGFISCACVVLITMICYKYKNYFRNMNCRNNPQLARGKEVPESVALNDV